MSVLSRIKVFFRENYILADIYKMFIPIFKKIKIAGRIIDIFLMYIAFNLYPKYTTKLLDL